MADIILVHGLWNRGWSMMAMARRFRARGHAVRVFSYPTRSDCLDGHADELRAFISKTRSKEINLVGHSLGGLVILNMLNRYDDLPPGRIVLMGTPVGGASVLRRLEKLPGQKLLFGEIRENLLQGFDHAPATYQTGMISGTRAVGLGRMTGKRDEPNDGSVTVNETHMAGLEDSIELLVAHSEMLLSLEVLEQAEHFISSGKFRHSQ